MLMLLRDFPDSSFSEKIETFNSQFEEETAWNEAKSQNTFEAFVAFQKRYKGGIFDDECETIVLEKRIEFEISEGKKAYLLKDYDKAFELFFKHKDNKSLDSEAQRCLGYIFDIQQKYAEAMKWYKRAAERGDAKGQTNLGTMYIEGKGIKKDYREGIKWLQIAAKQREPMSLYNLGVLNDLNKEYSEAIKWYKQAAEQGQSFGQNNLGVIHEEGKGTPKDINEAVRLYRLSAKQGNQDAKNNLKRLGFPE
jgi:TPR repeat protein